MRAATRRLSWLALLLPAFCGCHNPTTYTRPPLKEEYRLPPADDARFSLPPSYPKETLDTDTFHKEDGSKLDPNKAPDRFGAGPGSGMGMGRGGY
jgi:hypothetical protein